MWGKRQRRGPGWKKAAVGACLVAAGCGDATAPAPDPASQLLTAATLGEQSVKSVADYLAEAPYAGANSDLGERLLLQCRACHTLDEGAGHQLGPNLYGMFGRRVGTAAGYRYTRALQEADFVWTPRALDAWLAQPQRFLPGNAMAFAGLLHPEDRTALITSLMRKTSGLTKDRQTEAFDVE